MRWGQVSPQSAHWSKAIVGDNPNIDFKSKNYAKNLIFWVSLRPVQSAVPWERGISHHWTTDYTNVKSAAIGCYDRLGYLMYGKPIICDFKAFGFYASHQVFDNAKFEV